MSPEEFHNSNKNGIYLFASIECKKCSDQKKHIKVPYTLVECEQDPELIYNNHGVDLIPCVRVYKDGNVVFEKICSGNDELAELNQYV